MNSGMRRTPSTAPPKNDGIIPQPAPHHMTETPLKIDLSGIIRTRLGKRGWMIPGFLLRFLEKTICQDRLNELLEKTFPNRGSRFSDALLKEMKISVDVEGLDRLPDGEAFEFACNHPLGGLDGIALVGTLGAKYGDENLRVLVNDLLLNVEPLKDVFLPVNKFGAQGRDAARAINTAFSEGKQILMFPAGLVSRIHPDGEIRDLKWQKAFVSKALEFGRRIVPVRFEGLNSMRFYRTARWRKRLGLKFNIEQILLPSELCRAEGKSFRIIFGEPVDPARMRREGFPPARIAEKIREKIYSAATH